MFTGIIERTAAVTSVADGSPGFRRIGIGVDWTDVKHGESVAVNGTCLTVAEMSPGELMFDVIPETLGKTNLAALLPGDRVNLERSLKVGDRVDGHFVQGHVDGLAKLLDVSTTDGEWRLTIEPPTALMKYLVPKGSVAIDGVSLTVAALDAHTFQVALIPTTLKRTTLESRLPGWMFNFEADSMAKTIVAFLERRSPATDQKWDRDEGDERR